MPNARTVDGATIRQLDEIQEDDGEPRGGRVAAMVMASFGGAAIVFAALALMRSPDPETPAPSDPLGALVAASESDDGAKGREHLAPSDVTFPGVLTDQDNPTTAMEAIRGHREDPLEGELPRAGLSYPGPPPATDVLPVVPLPAQDMIDAVPRPSVSPSDTLRTMAREVAREPEGGELAEPGHEGGYQLQVSSFKKPEDAEGFAMALRRRGHKAYVVAANVSGRGLWHRVRIGPFKYRRSAEIYRQDFEAKERIVTFVVDPPKARIEIAPAQD
jgi:DedD protein